MRAEKSNMVAEARQRIQGSPFVLVADYTGMTVGQFSELRKRLRAAGSKFTVVKNTVFRVAAREAGLPEMNGMLAGQTAVVCGEKDVCAAAKVLKNFAAEFTKPKMRGGVLDGAVLDAAKVAALADLPSREALLAQFLGLLTAPASRLARLLHTPASQVARVLDAKYGKGE